jgi:outer membrane receptor protein involved in Fe transport
MKLCRGANSALCLVFLSGVALAQLPTATVRGTVTDDSGAAVPAADVRLKNLQTGQTRTVTTAEAGSYFVPALPVGDYEERVSKQGFETSVFDRFTLTVAQDATVNVTLKIGAIEQQVTVSSAVQAVDTETATLGGTVDEQKMEDLPLNGRNFVQLALNEMGVAANTSYTPAAGASGTLITVNGAPVRSNAYLLDGATMQNAYGENGASIGGTTLGVDGIREFRVITNGFSAQYGGAMGSQILLVSQSGTNAIHGSLFDYFRNSDLDARNFFDPHTIPHFARNNYGGSLGGPIKRDKTFIFANYEGIEQRLGLTEVATVPGAGCRGAAGAIITNAACPQLGSTASVTVSPVIASILSLYPKPNAANNQYNFPFNEPFVESYGQVRVDHTFSGKDSLFGRYTIDDGNLTLPEQYPQFQVLENSRNQFITGAENHIFSPALLNTARFSYSQTIFGTNSPSGLTGSGYSLVSGQEIGAVSVGGTTALGPDAPSPTKYQQFIKSYADDVFYTRGAHSLQFGVKLDAYEQALHNSTNLRGSVTFANIASFLGGVASNYTAETPGSILYKDYKFWVMGFYVQDNYKVSRHLTLNLGLRYEPGTVPSEADGRSAALRNPAIDASNTVGPVWQNYTLKNFSPRFGFAWDATGDGKTSVRGSFAEMYDLGNMGSILIIGVAGAAPFSTIQNVGTSTTITLPLTFPAGQGISSQRLPDYHMQQPKLLQYSFSVQRQLPWDVLLTAAYAGSRGIHLTDTIDGNPIIPQIVNNQPFWPTGAARQNPNWGYIGLSTSQANSRYNAFQMELLKRLSNGLQFQLSYTHSRSIDTNVSQFGADSSTTNVYNTNPLNYNQDKGVSNANLPNNLRLNAIYKFRNPSAKGFVGGALGGWWVSSIVAVQNGLPFTVALNTNRSRSGQGGGASGIDRPDLAPGFTASSITSGTTGSGCLGVPAGEAVGTPTLYFNPCAFTLQAQGTLGDAGRNILEGPGMANVDFSLVKDTRIPKLGEGGNLQFRAEIFNIFNHTNFSEPGRIAFAGTTAGTGSIEAPLSTAGVITSTVTPSRQIQFALKLIF